MLIFSQINDLFIYLLHKAHDFFLFSVEYPTLESGDTWLVGFDTVEL